MYFQMISFNMKSEFVFHLNVNNLVSKVWHKLYVTNEFHISQKVNYCIVFTVNISIMFKEMIPYNPSLSYF